MLLKNLFLSTMLLFGMATTTTNLKVNTEVSLVEIQGTSTLHDWTMHANSVKTSGMITRNAEQFTPENLQLTFPVAKLESGKDVMNSNTVKALNGDDYPNISFAAKSIAHVGGPNYTVAGNLTINGKTKAIQFKSQLEELPTGKFKWQGNVPLKMTDYGVEPPEVMFGTISTGNDITIKFSVITE